MNLISGTLCILGLDPGGTTGWASYDAEVIERPDKPGTYEFYNEKWNSGQIGPNKHHGNLWALLELKHARNFIIVCESFEYHREQRDNVVLVSLEYIGVTKLFYEQRLQYTATPLELVMQTASTGKSFWYPKKPGTQQRDATKLKAVNHYSPGMTHANDAMAHLLHYMTFTMDRKDQLGPLK